MVSVIVPAAGMSTRMGHNKLLLTFRDKPLIVHAVDTLLAADIDEIVVVLGHQIDQVRDHLKGKPVRIVQNPNYQEGLSTSVRAGVEAISRETGGIMIYLADQPLLEPADVKRIVAAFGQAKKENKSIVVPFFRGQRGNPVILDTSLRIAILGIAGDVGCKGVIKRYPGSVYHLEMENDHVVRDVDDVKAYERLVG